MGEQGSRESKYETEPVIQDVTPTEVIQDQESSEKGSAEVSTAGAKQELEQKKDLSFLAEAIRLEKEKKLFLEKANGRDKDEGRC
ncbi:hypothetical protein Tco_0531502 [Tanacetum coccineum]